MIIFFKIALISTICLLSCGCYSTTRLYDSGELAYNIDNIQEAYLVNKDKIEFKVNRSIEYHTYDDDHNDGESSEKNKHIEECIIGVDLNKTEKRFTNNISDKWGEDTRLHKIVKRDQLNVNLVTLFDAKYFHSHNKELPSDANLIIIKDEDLTSLVKSFIYRIPKTSFTTHKYYLMLKDDRTIQMVELPNHQDWSQPAWWPLKVPLYPLTISFDLITLPFQAWYWFEHDFCLLCHM